MYEFAQAMIESGITPPSNIIGDGKIHRFKVDSKDTKSSGYYILHTDEPVNGIFGSYKNGIEIKWHSQQKEYDKKQYAELRKKAEDAAIKRELELKQKREQCREKSKIIWERSLKEGKSEYLLRKRINTNGARFTNCGDIVIPLRNTDGIIQGLQFINKDGKKLFMANTNKRGSYFSIGKKSSAIAICEGFATGATIHECTGMSVAVAFDAGNMEHVAAGLKKKYGAELIVCADNDEAGKKAAERISKRFKVKVFYPPKDGQDFNDLFVEKGEYAVSEIFF